MATIKDVAAMAGVSFTTVSHVLNDTRAARPETRERVLAAARALDYVPSAVARSLRHRVTHTVGLLVPNSTNPFFAELARGIEDACYRSGYSVLLCNSDDLPERQQTYLRALNQKRVDGLIVASASADAQWVSALRSVPFPVVVVDREIAGLAADLVQLDGVRGGQLAAEHLVALGHRRIGCISGPPRLAISRERRGAFEVALGSAGLSLPDRWVDRGDFRILGGYNAARRLLANAAGVLRPSAERPSALFACNDLMAIGALRAAAELHLPVPGELSVIGFDDIELSRYVYPSLSTVGQPVRELGEATAAALFARIAKPVAPFVHQRLEPALQARESSGPPPRDTSPA